MDKCCKELLKKINSLIGEGVRDAIDKSRSGLSDPSPAIHLLYGLQDKIKKVGEKHVSSHSRK